MQKLPLKRELLHFHFDEGKISINSFEIPQFRYTSFGMEF